ncbi:MAG: class I SAM-dependent methyltransferase [Spirochaetaceae bacterium]|jgi:23S rRNA G2069 N7-methylase RlmK/C1962 C5-methylase RlmI|nr:class I SAM-dependent methyltransferase [Spirochaetaceae bacterium]
MGLPEDKKNALQGEMFYNRIVKRYRHLKKWARRNGIEAFRLYDRDIPEIPLTLDIYGDAVSLALYERPYEKPEADEAAWLNLMRETAALALRLPPEHIVIKFRRRQRGKNQYEKINGPSFERVVQEGDLKFRVNLSGYLDTGLFLDRRAERAYIRSVSGGKKLLNLFCYTASFSVYAAAGGALAIDSVDLSNTYLNWARSNFELNGFAGNRAYRFIRSDVPSFLEEAAKRKLSWDLIVLDPPLFSNSKMTNTVLDLKKDYTDLVRRCLALLNPKGVLCFCVNTRRFSFDGAAFPQSETRVFSGCAGEDFRGKKTPPCYILRV